MGDLIAYYLQTGQPSKILGEIGRYREFGYEQLPFDWDQALCISLRENPSLNANRCPRCLRMRPSLSL